MGGVWLKNNWGTMNKLSIIISILIALSGYIGAKWLQSIDQELRVIYSEHTLAVTDLAHIYVDLIRYRTTILRAIEADSEQDFTRTRSSLSVVRARMAAAVDRYILANSKTSAGARLDARELKELKEVQARLDTYLATSDHTIGLISQMWAATTPVERERLRKEGERFAAIVAGPKLIDVTIALEDLLTMVGKIAGEIRNDGDRQLRIMTIATITVTLLLMTLVLRPLNPKRIG